MTLAEARRRVTLSIDRQLSGEIGKDWPIPCQIDIEGPAFRYDGEEVLMVIAGPGLWAIRDDGSLLRSQREKMH